ncbi:aldehyde dehydrogenase family protein [Pelagibacterium sp. 26DY04]|uniref:L-piperidine-6-carboxylate dehydrogenase n=1 Tax=Pelagibacterium sp. 26DY04 TaxID=2967130 RepID=UPI002815330E|nr:aldehyde dehydrogenase family protein [Pelagibacterium sp. 26DY04]WMT86363.1 aldehyde dehydrogenase family protein [Pelagibacterium sp. 26DY04]
MSHADILKAAFLDPADLTGGSLKVHSPIDGALIGEVATHDASDVEAMIARAKVAFGEWRLVPAPRRGELIRLFGEELRAAKDALGALVSLEAGKILQEGLGEVQEMIDICDLAVGQSRQLFGLTIASERPGHSMRETWHPLGVTGVISAFNFPVAVFAWNFALATICGNTTIWKPSEKTPLTALAVKKIFEKALARFGEAPQGMLQVAVGGAEVGEALTGSKDVPLISATGSTRMGRIVGPRVAERFGRTILELGGNNAMIVAPSADLDNAVRAIVFSAVGTCGQRCTSLRRLIVHEDVRDQLVAKLKSVYGGLPIGDPLEKGTLVGPLIDNQAFEAMQHALEKAKAQGGKITGGEKVEAVAGGHYVRPAIVEMVEQTDIVKHETFAPILYVLTYKTLEEAIALQNDVPQGLSSCIFSTDVRETETFLSAAGSDCGIANVNIGPSGAEIGGAFGGEKETGGGRESGSDAWKAYMRRQTNTVNYSRELPLAQGIKFDI